MTPITRMLLARLRRSLDAQFEDGCQLNDNELLARGLALQLEALGVSSYVNAGMIAGNEPEPA